MIHDFIVSLYGETTYQVLAVIFALYPLWLPPLLGMLFWETWLRFVRYNFFINTPVVLLEIRLPKEITQSPVNMELAINAFHTTSGESTFIDRYWLGKTRAWFSLELVSFSGEIHFYIWTRVSMRNIVESQMYSQFPSIEIREVEDYAKKLVFDPLKNNMWATNYIFTKPNPYPLRTYIDYGLDKNPKPEFATDPLTTLLEFMGTMKPGEILMIQFVIRAHKKEKHGGFFSKSEAWDKQIDKVRKEFIKHARAEGRNTLNNEESKIIDILDRSIVKQAFDVGIRCIYFAETREIFNGGLPTYLRGHLWKPFTGAFSTDLDSDPEAGSKHYGAYNNFKMARNSDTDYPWQDFFGIRMNFIKRHQLSAYKRRMFFYPPYQEDTMIMTSETLATLFHFPGSYAATPGLNRIESKRGQAPANLPV